MYINSVKYACQNCIRGHRSTNCHHTERPLFEIKKKGRPVSQCPHCRQLRKIRDNHARCECASRVLRMSPDGDKSASGTTANAVTVTTANPHTSNKFDRILHSTPASNATISSLPNGLRDVAIQGATNPNTRQKKHEVGTLLNACGCPDGQPCVCGTSIDSLASSSDLWNVLFSSGNTLQPYTSTPTSSSSPQTSTPAASNVSRTSLPSQLTNGRGMTPNFTVASPFTANSYHVMGDNVRNDDVVSHAYPSTESTSGLHVTSHLHRPHPHQQQQHQQHSQATPVLMSTLNDNSSNSSLAISNAYSQQSYQQSSYASGTGVSPPYTSSSGSLPSWQSSFGLQPEQLSHHSQQSQHLVSLPNIYYRDYEMQSSSHLFPAKPGTKRSGSEDHGSERPPHYQRHANNTHSDVGINLETSPIMQQSKSVSPLALDNRTESHVLSNEQAQREVQPHPVSKRELYISPPDQASIVPGSLLSAHAEAMFGAKDLHSPFPEIKEQIHSILAQEVLTSDAQVKIENDIAIDTRGGGQCNGVDRSGLPSWVLSYDSNCARPGVACTCGDDCQCPGCVTHMNNLGDKAMFEGVVDAVRSTGLSANNGFGTSNPDQLPEGPRRSSTLGSGDDQQVEVADVLAAPGRISVMYRKGSTSDN